MLILESCLVGPWKSSRGRESERSTPCFQLSMDGGESTLPLPVCEELDVAQRPLYLKLMPGDTVGVRRINRVDTASERSEARLVPCLPDQVYSALVDIFATPVWPRDVLALYAEIVLDIRL